MDANVVSPNNYSPNVWFAGPSTMYRYNQFTRATLAFPVGVTPLAITADGAGNVYFTAVSGGTGSRLINWFLRLRGKPIDTVGELQATYRSFTWRDSRGILLPRIGPSSPASRGS